MTGRANGAGENLGHLWIMQADCIDILQELESWYALDNGQYLLEVTREATREMLDTAFGYHILQLGVRGGEPLCQGSRINHQLYCADSLTEGVSLVAQPDELPFDSDSVDAIIAHHCLEFAANPHQVLREIQRVLTPQGQLLIIGFNPLSLFGCKARLRALLRDPFWSCYRPVTEHRLTDWLHLLSFEVLDTRWRYGLPPLGRGRLRRALVAGDTWFARYNLPVGGVYILRATKNVAAMHRPRRPLLTRRGRLIGLVPKPAATPRSGYSREGHTTDQGDHAA